MSGKRYQSGYDDGFRAGQWAGQRDVLPLMEAAVKLVLPYEGLLADSESRRWIAPTLWTAIEEGVKAVRAALTQPGESAGEKEEGV